MGHVVLAGTDGYAKIADSAALDIAGDQEIRFFGSMDDSTPALEQPMVSKWGGAGQRSWNLVIRTNNFVRFYWTEDGSTAKSATSTVAWGRGDGVLGGVGVTIDVDDGAGGYEVGFIQSTDGITWTALGTATTGVGGTTSVHAGTADVNVGAKTNGTADLDGTLHAAAILNGIGGAAALDIDFTDLSAAEVTAASFVEDSANAATVTIEGADWSYVGSAGGGSFNQSIAGPGQLLRTGG